MLPLVLQFCKNGDVLIVHERFGQATHCVNDEADSVVFMYTEHTYIDKVGPELLNTPVIICSTSHQHLLCKSYLFHDLV